MKIYVDSSWLLRVMLQQGVVSPLPKNAAIYSSVLLRTECMRVFDRHHKRKLLNDEKFIGLIQQLNQYANLIEYIEIDKAILQRAAEPFALPIATLDALHLATALRIRDAEKDDLHFATFDDELALAAMAHGFKVIKK